MKSKVILGLVLASVSLEFCPVKCGAADATNLLSREAYVWQREWNGGVREAVAEHGSNFDKLVLLKAEVSWQGTRPQLVRVPVDFTRLRKANVGLALRIGPYAGSFAKEDPAATFLTGLAAALVEEAKAGGCPPDELQIDFDCAQSKLDGYRVWVEGIRRKIAPVPVVITVLQSWLTEAAFGRLVAATDGYVLQVHSLERPRDADAPFTLCDPAAAQRAVERAGGFAVPFRVALPTYGYVLAFDRSGKFAGLSAEGPAKSWPPDAKLREVRTDPAAMAGLVRTWSTRHPAAMRGIIWYRLPVAGEALNLRWPTLAAMMAGRSPREHAGVEARRVEAGLTEISLVNDGELDLSSRLIVRLSWQNARMLAGDGLRGFELADDGASAAQFTNDKPSFRLPAGERQIIGWVRLSEEREVRVEIKKM